MSCEDLTIDVTLVPDGCGIEYSGGTMYSIGNQNIDASHPASDSECGTITVTINGQTPPIIVCDADEISVELTTENCDCEWSSTTCTQPSKWHLVSRVTADNKLSVQLEYNPGLTKLKKMKALQRLRKKIVEKKMKAKIRELADQQPS